MTVALNPAPDLSFDELVEALSGLAKNRLSFALVHVELSQRLGREPPLREIWAEYARRYPEAIRGVRAVVARGLVALPSGEEPSDPLVETSLELLQLAPLWWHRLESTRSSSTG